MVCAMATVCLGAMNNNSYTEDGRFVIAPGEVRVDGQRLATTGEVAVVASNLTDEITRATDAEAVLRGNISTNAGNISTNKTDISSNLASIGSNDTDIAVNVGNISTNAENITTNVTDIEINAGGISTNAGNISTNTDNITVNVGGISTNAGNISTNAEDIIINAGGVSTNAGNITTNTQDILVNAGNITTNAEDIVVNAGGVSTNAGNISTNAENIAAKVGTNDVVYLAAITNATITGGTSLVVSVTGRILGITVRTNFVENNTGNWDGTWQGLGTNAFQPAGSYATGTPVYVESDPVWESEKSGYATGTPLYVYSETDPVWESEKGGYATGTPLYVESYVGTIVGGTIVTGAAASVTTNAGSLDFVVPSGGTGSGTITNMLSSDGSIDWTNPEGPQPDGSVTSYVEGVAAGYVATNATDYTGLLTNLLAFHGESGVVMRAYGDTNVAFGAPDLATKATVTIVSNAFGTADTIISNAYVAADLVVSNAYTNTAALAAAAYPASNPSNFTSGGGGITLSGYELAVSSKNGWGGYVTGDGSTTNNAIVVAGWSTANATNNYNSGWAFYSSADDVIQDKYAYADIPIPSYATGWGATAIVVRVRSSGTAITTNKVNLLFNDGVNAFATNDLVSSTADTWREYPILASELPASWTNDLDNIRPYLSVRGDYFSWMTNYIQWVEIWCDWE